MGAKKRKRKASRGQMPAGALPDMENSPQARELACAGFPPVQFTVRMDGLIQQLMPDDPNEPPSARALHLMRGVASVMASRFSDPAARDQLNDQLAMFHEVLPLAEMADAGERSAAGDDPSNAAWTLIGRSAELLDRLCGAGDEPAPASAMAAISLTPDELRHVILQGGLAPDTLASLATCSPGPGSVPARQAAETCFFLAVAALEGPSDAQPAMLAIAQRVADSLQATGLMSPAAEKTPSLIASLGERLPSGLSRFIGGSQTRRTKKQGTKPAGNWYQLKITMDGIKPPIWRRIVVPDCTLDWLDDYIRCSMGWEGDHLSAFEINREHYSVPTPFGDSSFDDGMEDGTLHTLGEFVGQGTKRLKHSYDFGDGWEHLVVVEKVIPPDQAPNQPACLEGARACPPEDCGGVWGYQELLEAAKDSHQPENQERLEWVGDDWDPESFNPKHVTLSMPPRS